MTYLYHAMAVKCCMCHSIQCRIQHFEGQGDIRCAFNVVQYIKICNTAICDRTVNMSFNLRDNFFLEFRSLKFAEQTVMSENKIFSNGHQVREKKNVQGCTNCTRSFYNLDISIIPQEQKKT